LLRQYETGCDEERIQNSGVKVNCFTTVPVGAEQKGKRQHDSSRT